MSAENSKRSKSSSNLDRLYRCGQDINQCRQGILFMATKEQERGYVINEKDCRHMDQLLLRMNRLCLLQHDEKIRTYSNANVTREMPEIPDFPPIGLVLQASSRKSRDPQPRSKAQNLSSSKRARTPSPPPVLVITNIKFRTDQAIIDMSIDSKKNKDDDDQNDQNDIDKDIVYPKNVKDFQPYQTVAKFRKMLGISTNFIDKPLCLGEDETETTVLGLNSFAQKHGCDLMFTNTDHGFDNSMYRAACGTADLGSMHLLATDAVQTATFIFVMDFEFQNEFKQSKQRVEKFVDDFRQSVATVLNCDQNNVRMFSISKSEKEKKKCEVKFGLTSADINQTDLLAHALKDQAQKGFHGDKILQRVIPLNYDYTWTPALQTLKICASDLDPNHNFDYRPPFSFTKDTRGGFDYFFPKGWYRHALRVVHKYGDSSWIGQSDSEGVWPVAFHGTKSWAVESIVDKGFMTGAIKHDAMRLEAIQQKGKEVDRPGLYVATHCDRGAAIYTEPFEVPVSADKTEKYRIVFQCRVKPGEFTTHTSPVNEGHAWRFVDPTCIRPYGILLKKET